MTRRLLCVFVVTLMLMLAACQDPDTAPREVEAAVSEQTTSPVAEWVNDALFSLEKDGYWLLVGSYASLAEDMSNTNPLLRCRLVAQDGSYDRTMLYSIDEMFLTYALFEGSCDIELELDTATLTARLTAEKTNLYFNFSSDTQWVETQYRLQDLKPENLLAESPDGTLALHATYVVAAGDTVQGDVVVLHRDTQEIQYLTSYTPLQLVFLDERSVLINRFYSMQYLDADTAQPLPNANWFDYGETGLREPMIEFRTVGIAHDSERDLILIAYCDTRSSLEPHWLLPLHLAVYNRDGVLVNTIHTEQRIPDIRGAYINTVDLELLGDGRVALSSYGPPGDDWKQPHGEIDLGVFSY